MKNLESQQYRYSLICLKKMRISPVEINIIPRSSDLIEKLHIMLMHSCLEYPQLPTSLCISVVYFRPGHILNTALTNRNCFYKVKHQDLEKYKQEIIHVLFLRVLTITYWIDLNASSLDLQFFQSLYQKIIRKENNI